MNHDTATSTKSPQGKDGKKPSFLNPTLSPFLNPNGKACTTPKSNSRLRYKVPNSSSRLEDAKNTQHAGRARGSRVPPVPSSRSTTATTNATTATLAPNSGCHSNNNNNSSRSLFLNDKPKKSGDNTFAPPLLSSKEGTTGNGGKEEVRIVIEARPGSRPSPVEQFSCLRCHSTDPSSFQNAHYLQVLSSAHSSAENKSEQLVLQLQEKLNQSDASVKNLKAEMLLLKAELDKMQSLNVDLLTQNQKLHQDLAAAHVNTTALTTSCGDERESVLEYQNPKFKDIQKLIAKKLEAGQVKKETSGGTYTIRTHSESSSKSIPGTSVVQQEVPPYASCPPLPPPPPPPPLRRSARVAKAKKCPSPAELPCLLTKLEGKKESVGPVHCNAPAVTSAHSSIVGEIQTRSAHLLAIRADIETKGDFINALIEKVLSAAYTDIEDVLKFVDWLDDKLSSLADEPAVLKHFKWPEKKADAMREAAVEYRILKLLKNDVFCYTDGSNSTSGAALKRMCSLIDRSERGIQRLMNLRNSVMPSYQAFTIPTDWMLDSGIVCEIKQAATRLAKIYLKRVTRELGSSHNSEMESAQEALLTEGVHFAYRAHQFAGGFDSETLCAFEEIRERVAGHMAVSGELLAAIPST